MRSRTACIGPRNVLRWARRLPPRAAVLDLGCGNGVPVSGALIEEGFTVYGVDASETLVADFRRRFPGAAVECSPVEDSLFFNRTFDAALAWGLMFLLPAVTQRTVIAKVARVLNRGGHFLFTSPKDACAWNDSLTGHLSISLGHEEYERQLEAHGFALAGADEDEGGNYYYFASRR